VRPIPVRELLAALSLLSASLLEVGCTSFGLPLSEVAFEVNATAEPGPTILAPGDTVQLEFPEKPDWELLTTVRPDGSASLGWLGDQVIGGSAPAEAEARLKEQWNKLYPDLKVNIVFGMVAPRNVYVMGEVQDPGEYPIQGRLTLVEALAAAGGPRKETAMLEYLLLVRWSAAEKRQRSWRIDASVEQWEEGVALLLQPHDVIFVPNTPIDDVDIWVDQYIRRLIPLPGITPPVY
jgi:protein involved in polysaccharide export with SLBB domain